jgi:membrane-bound inhibitor of C-type lysozyme
MPEQSTNTKKQLIIWGIIILLVIIGLFLFAGYNNKQVSAPTTQPSSTVASEMARTTTYVCDNNFSVNVIFSDNQAALSLSDGRTMTLLQTPVTEGVEFTNGDGSFIFLTKGPSATFTENGIVTHNNCIEPKG